MSPIAMAGNADADSSAPVTSGIGPRTRCSTNSLQDITRLLRNVNYGLLQLNLAVSGYDIIFITYKVFKSL